jgi:hypothetical protein
MSFYEKKLAASGISLDLAASAGLSSLTEEETRFLGFAQAQALKIDYYDIHQKKTGFYRIRYLTDVFKNPFSKKPLRFTQAAGVAPCLYIPNIIDFSEFSQRTDVPIFLAEGELKALCACQHKFPTLGLAGVWNWKSSKLRIPIIADFDLFKLDKRRVYLVFDADLKTNIEVKKALNALSDELTARGAFVYIIFLPELKKAPKTGLDDFLMLEGREAFASLIKSAEIYSLSKELHLLNTEFAVIKDPGLIVNLATGAKLSAFNFQNLICADRYYYVEKQVKKGSALKKEPAAPAWVRWPSRFVLDRIVYRPGQPRVTEDGCYNEWKGWGVEPREGPVDFWHQLLDYVFTEESASRKWFESWCAIQFQRPGIKLYAACIIWGQTEGTGKTLLGQTLSAIFGQNSIEISEEDLYSPYNHWEYARQFIIGDEITGSNSRDNAGKLKQKITGKEIQLNQKYMPVITMESTANYYFTSNRPTALYLTKEDRRFFVHNLNREPLALEFYLNYVKWLENGGASHLFQYFLKYDIGDFQPTDRAPSSFAKKEMVRDNLSELQNWVLELQENPDDHIHDFLGKDLWTSKELVALYNDGRQIRVSPVVMGRVLKAAGFAQIPQLRTHSGHQRLFVIRNHEKWAHADAVVVREHYERPLGKKGF